MFHNLRMLPPISDDTASDRAVTTIREWMKQCSKFHASCGKDPGPVQLPRRTLLISAEHSIRLSINKPGSTGIYACLSHCWGRCQPAMTTRETLTSFQHNGINSETLPRTFRDAIRLAHRLGVSHLWIDTLCIIQGDHDDWSEQSYEMAAIYSNALLTIAATASQDSAGGCFRRNTSPTWQSFKVTPPDDDQRREAGEEEEGEEASSRFVDLMARVSLHGHSQPLVDRGWVFQEQVLSRRVVYFNEHELAWTCRRFPVGRCECRQPGLFQRGDMQGAQSDEWVEMVQRFTRRTLTYGSDRLPALSGIAREFHARRLDVSDGEEPIRLSNWVQQKQEVSNSPRRRPGRDAPSPLGRYLSGLWEGSFLKHLAWENGSTRLGFDAPRSRRPAAYRSPTWSWPSIDDRIDMGWYNDATGRTLIAQVIAVECVPVSPRNVFGEVASGYLDLWAPLVRLSVRVDRKGYMGNAQWHVVTSWEEGWWRGVDISIEHLAFDTLEVFEEAEGHADGIQVACAVMSNQWDSYFGATSLVLRAVAERGDQTFERVGIAKLRFKLQPRKGDEVDVGVDGDIPFTTVHIV